MEEKNKILETKNEKKSQYCNLTTCMKNPQTSLTLNMDECK